MRNPGSLRRPTFHGARLALLAALLALAAGCRERRPNLLFVSFDTTRADHLGAYGATGVRTSAIDALATRGFVFRRHLTPVPITLPSHASMMTGLFPPTHTVRDNGTFVLPDDQTTLAEVLSKAGYRTSAFVASFPLARRFGLAQGFDVYDDEIRPIAGAPSGPQGDVFFDERPAGAVVDAAIRHFEADGGNAPFFTFLHFFDPHQPQLPPAPWDVEFRDRPYDGEIAFADSQLGRFLDFLAAKGELERTIVVVTADHGEGLGDHGEQTHSMLLHQATLHVPLVIAGPGVPRGETAEWTSSPQLFATLLDLLGVRRPQLPESPAPSLVPLVAGGGTWPAGTAPFTAYFETAAPRTTQGWSQLTAWMEGDWRYVHGPAPELYDLGADPREAANRFAGEGERATELLRDLRKFLRASERKTFGQSVQTVDREALARLAALGYLQVDPSGLAEVRDLLDVAGLIDPKTRVADIALFTDAKAAMASGKLAVSEHLWRELLARSPSNVHALRSLAVILMMGERPEEALRLLSDALERMPEAEPLRLQRLQFLVEVGRPEEALESLEKVTRGTVEAETWIGQALVRVGRRDEAEAAFRAGLSAEPSNRWLRLYLANLLAGGGREADAAPLYEALVRDEPYFSLAFYNLGVLRARQGRTREALEMLERAARLAPSHEGTRAALDALRAGNAAATAEGETR